MKKFSRMMLGFSILELMITLGVIISLGAIALPSYRDYLRRSYFNQIVTAANTYKAEVITCFEEKKSLKDCNAGKHDIHPAITVAKDAVASLTVKEGVITVVPVPSDGISASDTYVLTPAIVNKKLVWKSTGGGVTKGYAS